MRNARSTIEFVESHQLHMLERPHMFAATPESFEDQLMLLETIRAYILEVDELLNPYSTFLVKKGFGAATVDTRQAEQGVTDPDVRFSRIADVFREYHTHSARRSPR